jgi:ferredoxin-type protein NapG
LFTGAARGIGAAIGGGSLWAYLLTQQSKAEPFALRPPGALAEDEFQALCVKCGLCVADCPYDTLKLGTVGDPYPIGTPYFEPRDVPCYMCPDIPCIEACPTGALDTGLEEIDDADMGLAVLIDQENCLSYRGLRCEICYRACPLQDQAITIENRQRGISKHAMFVPIVHSDACTGCGICENACPLPEATIKVLPQEIAQGKLGEHYDFGWLEDTELTPEFQPGATPPPAEAPSGDAALDYLNEGEL